jgi:hypothetical protein
LLEEAERNPQKKHVDDMGYPTDVVGWLDSSVYFNSNNESLQDRDEEVVVPWTNQALKGGQAIRATADDVHIPYIEDPAPLEFRPLNLSLCTKMEIEYRPSVLEYFLPFPGEQRLLSAAEVKYLQSLKTVLSDDQRLIKAMADEINESFDGGQIVTEFRTAHVVCYRGDERLTSFTVYDGASIETEDKQCFWHRGDLQSIRMLTPQIEPFELRVWCAANLKDLWYRLRLYQKAEKMRLKDSSSRIETAYPKPTKWCDDMMQAYEKSIGMLGEDAVRPHKCPSAGDGKNHYAINPDCKYDSPADMVLLFETKAGWNQNGGPELFTFDNHDPKGGCVLLNDGTVKFIRTTEELQQLRWK